jgi:hypothetical protein
LIQRTPSNVADAHEAGGIDNLLLFLAAGSVVATGLLLRLPSCGESYWLDELHSAWTVSGLLGDVAPRAAAGNQTTGYFHLLWIWSQIFGDDEIAMRASSVVASCLACALLVVGVAWRTGRIAAGVVAGGMLAIDPNAIFFGCELRSYSVVMLCSVLAVWSMMVWLGGQGSGAGRSDRWASETRVAPRWRLGMLFWICVAALVHPTSAGVLWMLIPPAFYAARKTGRLNLSRADAIAGVVIVATMGALAMSSLPDSWQRRDLWKAFGQATRWWQLWWAWSWVPMVVLPAVSAVVLWGIAVVTLRVSKRTAVAGDWANGEKWIGIIPGCVGIVASFAFFIASYAEWVPLWHRRYFIAALPLLAWSAGEWSAIGIDQIDRITSVIGRTLAEAKVGPRLTRLPVRPLYGPVFVVTLLGFQLWYQGTWQTLAAGRLPVQLRGEHWREAVARVQAERRPGDQVWLDSGLIEASFLRRPVGEIGELTEQQWGYLKFPLRGPYRLDAIQVVACGEHESWMRQHLSKLPRTPQTVWLVSRSGKRAAEHYAKQLSRFRTVSAVPRHSGRPFVLRLEFGE